MPSASVGAGRHASSPANPELTGQPSAPVFETRAPLSTLDVPPPLPPIPFLLAAPDEASLLSLEPHASAHSAHAAARLIPMCRLVPMTCSSARVGALRGRLRHRR